jgi:hypothetical protein
MPKRRSGPPQRIRPLHDQELTARPLVQEVRLVVCPRCDGCARFVTDYVGDPPPTRKRRMYCRACSLVQDEPTAAEPWLRTTCCGHVLWAHDDEHLQLLEDYVRSPLRERLRIRLGERAQLARLPRWLILARHRDEVLRALARLRRMMTAEA